MTTLRSEAEIVTFRKLAQELAQGRKERATSVHLLAALAARPGAARELLRERRLDDEALLKAGRSFDETAPDAIARAITSARELAKRSTGAAPGGLHVLLALLADRRSAAHRALEIAGVDLARLRGAAMQQAIGAIATRRVPPLAPPERAPGSAPGERGTPAAPARAAARQLAAATPIAGDGRNAPASAHAPPVAIPLFPQSPRRPRDEGRATPVVIAPGPRARAAPPAEPVALPRLAAEAAAAAQAAVTAPRRATGRRGGHELSFQGDELTLDRGRCPVLCALGRNLTAAAAAGELDDVVARGAEIEHVLDVLAKRTAPSACLVGPAGVGKTAVARGVAAALLAHAEATGTRPRLLVELVSSELVAGTGARGALAERLAAIRAEVRGEGGRVVLFVDDVHELVGGGAPDEATAELKLGLARGELTLLGATTPEEYKKAIESDPVLARRFTVVEIEEPSEEVAFSILRRVADGLAAHHGLGYPDDAVTAAIAWSARYLPGRALPDKAAAILDLAGARARRRPPREEPAARRASRRAPERTLTLPDVAAVVAELADIPPERLLETDAARMLGLEALLAERVVGHDWALSRIATVLRRNAAGLRGRRPIGTFLLLGPTGVGKTETAKAIAAALFHSPTP